MANMKKNDKKNLKKHFSGKERNLTNSNNIDDINKFNSSFNSLSQINYNTLNEKLISSFNSLNKINYNTLNEKLVSSFNSLSQINYNTLNEKLISSFNSLNKINYNALNEKLVSSFNSLSQINYNTLNEKLISSFNNLSQINYNTLNEKLISSFNNLSQINYNALNEKLVSSFNNLSQINYNTLNEKLISSFKSLNQINYNALSEKLTYAFNKLNNNTLYSWIDNIYDYLDVNSYDTFAKNIQNVAPSIALDDFEVSDNDLIADSKKHLSNNFIVQLFTGTLSYDDIKNNKLSALVLIIAFWLVTTLITFILEDGYTYAKNYLKNNFLNTKEVITDEDYKNYRIITSNTLNVRTQPSTSSDIIGKLYYLNVVKIIESKPYWLKVEYVDLENDVHLTGWISKKYTKDFSKETEKLLNIDNN